jgi:hypothetical protein
MESSGICFYYVVLRSAYRLNEHNCVCNINHNPLNWCRNLQVPQSITDWLINFMKHKLSKNFVWISYFMYFFVGYSMISVSGLYNVEWWVDWWVMNLKGFGREKSWFNWGTVLAFAKDGLKKNMKHLCQDSCVTKIWAEHLMNTNLMLPTNSFHADH